MNPEDKRNLVAAWELHHKILTDIKKLANCNVSLAYGLIRTAQMIVNVIFLRQMQEAEAKDKESK